MGNLNNKIAVITGGSTGIGLATAQRFIADGAQVVITGRNKEALELAVAELGDRATGIRGDVANLDDLDRLFARYKNNSAVSMCCLLTQELHHLFRSKR